MAERRDPQIIAAANKTGKLAAVIAAASGSTTAAVRTPLKDQTHARNKDLSPDVAIQCNVLYATFLRPGNTRMHRDDVPRFLSELKTINVSRKACMKVKRGGEGGGVIYVYATLSLHPLSVSTQS